MRNHKKLLAYLAVGLGSAQLLLGLVSWILTAAMPEYFMRSLTSPEGIRWFMGHFVDHLASPWLVWLMLVSVTIGVVKQSGVLRFDHSQYRQRTAMRLMLVELIVFILVLLALTMLPHAIMLNVLGGLYPSSFSRSLLPYLCFSIIVMALSYGWMSENIKGIVSMYDALNVGIRMMAPCFLFYILLMQLYTSVMYLLP